MSDSTELYYAHMEADRNEAEAAYFKARPSLGTEVDHCARDHRRSERRTPQFHRLSYSE